ncbi:MAG: hypothetical protein COU51_01560 [Parcubacteria group bacterium CG10_big_fil_rev_8_21_14_0_10_36_14]|nr:MAG: hypothetical protein COU51_01560 [Parcubacteria group bacterium CG10_big_fil_rev_8_21_14_0_10_36_14]
MTIGGTGTGLGKLTVVGDADEVQFVIKANGTQNKNLTEWRNSSNTILGYMSPAGNFGASGTLRVDGASTFAGTATFNGALTLGDGGDAVVINSSGWSISDMGNILGAVWGDALYVTGGIYPGVVNSYQLGASNNYWNEAFFGELTAYGSVLFGGTVNVSTGVILTNGFICVDNDGNCSFVDSGYGRADGWVTVADDLAEDYLVNDFTIEAGDVVSFDRSSDTHVIRTTSTYNSDIIGVISTKPGLHIGYADDEMSKEDRRPVALAGRVPVKVSNENGAIQIGDYLTSASLPGYAMKMTEPGVTVGRALSPFDGSNATSTVIVFVNTGWYNGDETATSFGEEPTLLSVSTDENNIGPITTANNDLDLGGHSILNIASLSGMEDLWQIDETGNFITKGEIIKTIATSVGDKDFYPVYNEDPTIMLNGSGELLNGEARIMFDPALSEIMDPNELLSVTISMTSEGAQGIYVAEKSIADILVKEINGGMGSARFDYIIIAKRKMSNIAPPPNLPPSTEGGEDTTTSTSTPESGGFENSLLAGNTTSTQETATSSPESSVIASDSEAISSTTSTEEGILAEGTDIDQQIADLEESISELQRLIDEASVITGTSSSFTNPALSDSIVIEESTSSTPVVTAPADETSTSTIAGI